MKKTLIVILAIVALMSSCAHEFNKVYRSNNYQYRYEYAKQCYFNGKYSRAIILLQELITLQKGTDYAQESLYMLAMAEFKSKDYSTAADYFKKYCQSYPRGSYAEYAQYYVGRSLYMSAPEPRLDQSATVAAIAAFQEYLDLYPEGALREEAQQNLFALQDKLVQKELYTAQLYYDLGTYFGNCTNGGNNYAACVVTAQNALKDFPYSKLREDFALLLIKSKYGLATQSVDALKMERYQDAEDECYGFINEYPDSKNKVLAERYIEKCKEVTKN